MPIAAPTAAPFHVKPAAAAAAAHAFKGLRDPVEVFRAGTHTDSKGRESTFTAADLDQLVANVTGAGVPAVLGHPKDTDPAYAWARLRRDGDALLAEFGDIAPEFEAAVDSGAYRERSISIYRDPARGWVPQHIGWLGAVPPALALKPLQYSRQAGAPPQGAEVLTFSAAADTGWALGDMARLLRGLRHWLIGDKGLDLADKVLPDWTIQSVADAGRRVSDAAMAETDDPAAAPAFSSSSAASAVATTPGARKMPTHQITEDEAQRQRDQAAAALQLQSQFTAQSAELAALRAQRSTERIGAQISGWLAAGVLTPAEEPGLAEFMAAVEGGQAVEFAFSAADKSQASKTPAQWFAEFMAARKPIKLAAAGGSHRAGLAGEPLPGAVDQQDYRAITRAAHEFIATEAKAGRTVSVAQAVVHLTNPAAGG